MKKGIIFDFNRTLYDPDLDELVPGAKSVLKKLKERGYKLFLVSHGSYRKSLISELGVENYFDKIVISKEKSLEDFKEVTLNSNLTIKESFVVGDRVKGEIRIGNILGFNTVWLKKGLFAQEVPENLEEFPDFTIADLEEVLDKAP